MKVRKVKSFSFNFFFCSILHAFKPYIYVHVQPHYRSTLVRAFGFVSHTCKTGGWCCCCCCTYITANQKIISLIFPYMHLCTRHVRGNFPVQRQKFIHFARDESSCRYELECYPFAITTAVGFLSLKHAHR